MNKADKLFKKNIVDILNQPVTIDPNCRAKYIDNTPAYTRFVTHVYEDYDLEYSLSNNGRNFPVTTLRNTAIKLGIEEVFWIYQDESDNLEDARDRGITWWDEFNIGDGTIGHRYGYVVGKYNLLDNLINGLKDNPFGRRHIIDLYQYQELYETKGLHPCAFLTTWNVRNSNGRLMLDMHLHQRSNDYITAGYINKAQYVALQMMVAHCVGMEVGKFSHFIDNLHIYDRHTEAAIELYERESLKEPVWFYLNKDAPKNFYEISIENFTIFNPAAKRKLRNKIELAI